MLHRATFTVGSKTVFSKLRYGVLLEEVLERGICGLDRPLPPLASETHLRLVAELPIPLQGPPPRGMPSVKPAVPPRLEDRLDALGPLAGRRHCLSDRRRRRWSLPPAYFSPPYPLDRA